MTNQKNPNPIGDKVNAQKKPEPVKAQEVRSPTLAMLKARGIELQGDYFDDKFGRA